ncbi:MAG: SPOR domain-containing protein [Acidobacteriota bacterium]
MEELHATMDDQSHYEISLTAGQAFAAFVLLLLSLAAAFAFGLMIGKGQADERLVVRKETPVVTEARLAPAKNDSRIVELGVQADEFQETAPTSTVAPETAAPAVIEEPAPAVAEGTPSPAPSEQPVVTSKVVPAATPAVRETQPLRVTTYAQLLSTGDQRTAENLAARLIDRGFNNAYVERGTTEKGSIYRVRVKFDSEPEARAAEAKLKEFSREVWITTK